MSASGSKSRFKCDDKHIILPMKLINLFAPQGGSIWTYRENLSTTLACTTSKRRFPSLNVQTLLSVLFGESENYFELNLSMSSSAYCWLQMTILRDFVLLQKACSIFRGYKIDIIKRKSSLTIDKGIRVYFLTTKCQSKAFTVFLVVLLSSSPIRYHKRRCWYFCKPWGYIR